MRDVALTDKYTRVNDRVIMSGTHALVRLPLLQKQIDLAIDSAEKAGF
jgi:indolepyruvate ferredoxin oxidoreductase